MAEVESKTTCPVVGGSGESGGSGGSGGAHRVSVECGPAVTSELYAERQIDALSLVKTKNLKAHYSRYYYFFL